MNILSYHAMFLHCFKTPMPSCQSGHLLSTYSFTYDRCGGHNFLCPTFSTKFQLQFTHHSTDSMVYSITYTPSKMMNAHCLTMPCFSIVSTSRWPSCQSGHLLSTFSFTYIYVMVIILFVLLFLQNSCSNSLTIGNMLS